MLHGSNSVMIEALEGRRFLCATATATATETVSPALVTRAVTVTPNSFTSAQVKGHYKGSATVNVGGSPTVLPVRLTITGTSAKLTVTGYGSFSISLSAKQFKKLRSGNFSFTSTVNGFNVSLAGTVTKSGTRISGTFTATGTVTADGTFLLKKY